MGPAWNYMNKPIIYTTYNYILLCTIQLQYVLNQMTLLDSPQTYNLQTDWGPEKHVIA